MSLHREASPKRYVTLWTGCAALAVLMVLLFVSRSAQAQFVCGGSATGAEPQTGGGSTATGVGTVVCGVGAGTGADPSNTGNSAFGEAAGTNVKGKGNSAFGATAGEAVQGDANSAFGLSAGQAVQGKSNSAVGFLAGANVTGSSNSAFGDNAGRFVNGDDNIAIGAGAGSGAPGAPLTVSNTVAIGTNAFARADGGIALGENAQALGTKSVAIGAGAVATRPNQVVLGTADYTYTTPGITSAASKAAQIGPAQFVTTDAFGNLASDGGLIQSQINALGRRESQLADGIAISLALAQPIFQPDQQFAMRLGWGNFDGSNGVGIAAAGVLNRGYWGSTSAIILDGGVGVGTDERMVAGRAGLTFGW
jgi:hypothetical protein